MDGWRTRKLMRDMAIPKPQPPKLIVPKPKPLPSRKDAENRINFRYRAYLRSLGESRMDSCIT